MCLNYSKQQLLSLDKLLAMELIGGCSKPQQRWQYWITMVIVALVHGGGGGGGGGGGNTSLQLW